MTLPANLFGQTQGPRRGGRAQDREITDPYKQVRKLHEPTVCPGCGAVYREGRWQWGARPADAEEVVCQACHRIADDFPAGILALEGRFVPAHRGAIIAAVMKQQEAEKPEHPFNRIMKIADEDDRIVITTTDLHLPRRIGEALTRAFHGQLTLHYEEDGYFLRAVWHRD